MGGTAPICPFCKKELNWGGVKPHIKIKHPERYKEYIDRGQPPYFLWDDEGNFREVE